jgi:hypothetical protein
MTKNNYTSIKSDWFKCAYSNNNNGITSNSCPDLYTLSYKHLKTINTINSLGQVEKSIVKVQIDPAWQTFSNIINNSIYHTAGQKLTYANNTLNALGYWAGSPSGYGKPIRNTFN